ncbi:hypothetical protein N0V88_006756 [Collariella sp. IMI 366227]|nr:hypothetical protein N0V88_006756 [Collariella sp. IMI 366227]
MAEEDDFSALPITDRWVHKVRGIAALAAAMAPSEPKCLWSTRAAIKASALEALLLFIEIDVPGPVIEEILPVLSNKVPKVVAAALAALTQIYHNYGCKIADPKPVLKIMPKVFGHADKNVRAEATNLAVEFYRWLRDAMKPMFWNDLKPTQQNDLEAQFEKVKAEGAPKQERLLRSQQAAQERAPVGGGEDAYEDDADEMEDPGEVDAFDLAEPQDIISKVPSNFFDNLASSKWKERKEALEALHAIVNVPRIKDGDFNEINRCLAKCMKDANIAVVTQAAQCIELLAKGLRKGYAKYRTTVMQPIMERLKEKKVTVADALGLALDAVFQATDLTECLEDITTYLVHKNPQIKEGTMKFLVRCLRTTRDVPSKQEIQTIVDSAKKLLSESSEALRSGGAEILGTVMKIIGERGMNPHLEGLDDIRKTKIKEFFETAEVKAKEKPKPPPPAARAPPGGPKKVLGKKAPPELRMANERLLRQLEEGRHERSKLMSEIGELKNQNAGLIEDHTRDVLSIKAKETQLVRARSDCDAAEQTNDRLRRELERLKRALSKAEGQIAAAQQNVGSPGSPGGMGFRTMSPTMDDGGIYRDAPQGRNRMSMAKVTSQLKARIEQMKAKQASRPQ